ncbi:Transducin/WD40 repeat-like superfamily protein [Rhynchospora pubera]|uniref:Transducin/WD40 repeat-like superfamily protein n=1 Tax=Rhynchospora pubera TaxID=906938 RepID=A0AAV8D5S6_9POAL|nr:Transducin/WD40 repeat-like superfamily protein [Rhynchospora pubera]KAJ4762045.1 Transducin/WD40 repeat-like superfamily protein [Rhynchospora pubera]KAJ4814536.1 Transducin/WD40 repeat-like superfamily protein [Rhynchospora pubera]
MDRARLKRSLLRPRQRVTAKQRGSVSFNGGGLGSLRKRRNHEGLLNSVRKLHCRELGMRTRGARWSPSSGPERFRNIQLQEEFDTYDHNVHLFLQLQFLRKRSKIVEIVAAKDIIFALAQSGLCAAFSRTTNQRICFLNLSPDEVIRSLFYNKNNDSLITVSVYASDHFSSLKCRTTPIEYIRRNQLDAGIPLFETESLKWPGFVEFDDVNGKVLTYSAQDGIYKVHDLKNYNFLYQIPDKNVQEIKISPGIMLLIFERTPSHVPLQILSIEDGSVLKTFNHLLHKNKKVDFIEQFNEKLLVKQESENLQILDVRSSELTEVSSTDFLTPSAFIFLYENNLFLTFRNRTVAVWNFRGELVTSFEDHLLWHPDCSTNNIYITSEQDLIISYCKAHDPSHPPLPSPSPSDEPPGDATVGSINMSNILTGKCIAKISANDPELCIRPTKRGETGRSSIRSTVHEALEDVTALFYDEDRNEIYTGNKYGLVHVWSN